MSVSRTLEALPFACSYDDGAGSLQALNAKRVTQCALSRICGVCAGTLARPIAFVGTSVEAGRNAFHFPPAHVGCAEALLAAYAGVEQPVLGQDEVLPRVLVTTASFEFVRANREDLDRRATFAPGAILSSRTSSARSR